MILCSISCRRARIELVGNWAKTAIFLWNQLITQWLGMILGLLISISGKGRSLQKSNSFCGWLWTMHFLLKITWLKEIGRGILLAIFVITLKICYTYCSKCSVAELELLTSLGLHMATSVLELVPEMATSRGKILYLGYSSYLLVNLEGSEQNLF